MRKIQMLSILVFLVMVSCNQATKNQPKDNSSLSVTNDTTWKSLTLREKIGQTMLMLPEQKKELAMGDGSLKVYFQKYPVGGFFMGWKLFDGVKKEDLVKHIRQSCIDYQAASKLPLLFQQDYEGGVSLPGMTQFTNGMALGAADSPELAYAFGRAVAKQALSVGVKWVLSPVADLNMNPFNPITNVRSVSDNPDEAIKILSQVIKGLQDNGVAATIKHFPGDGVDYRDQHLLTSCNSLPFDVWKQKHGKVFQTLIDGGVDCIMPGHITLPSYQKEKVNGTFPPATLSKELLTNLLKGEMHFNGVIVSDAMVMGGFRGYYKNSLEGEIESFKAGVDILLWPSYEYMDTLEARIKRGEIPMARLDDAVQRIWNLKKKLGLLDKNMKLFREESPAEKAEADKTAKAIAEKAITLIRDTKNALPLNPAKDKKILVVGLSPISRKGGDEHLKAMETFANKLKAKGFQVDFQHDILYETHGWEDDAPLKYDRIIIAANRSFHAPYGPLGFYDDEAQTVWGINAMPKDKIIVVNFGNPYNTNEYFERVNTCINVYLDAPLMLDAVVDALMGKIKMTAKSPVNLDITSKLKTY
jgi:beta-N-acetylhexosaminidase